MKSQPVVVCFPLVLMSSSPPPEHRPPRRNDEEPIALIFTFLAFAAIAITAISSGKTEFSFAQLSNVFSALPSPGTSPKSAPASPDQAPAASIAPSTGKSALPGTNQPPENTQPPAVPPSPPAPENPRTQTAPLLPISPSGASPSTTPQTPVAMAPENPPSPTPRVAGTPIAFIDLPNSNWASPYIRKLSALGIVAGFSDRSFKPNQAVTRAELAAQIQKAFNRPDKRLVTKFTDIPATGWQKLAVNKAVAMDFMSGYPEGVFRPDHLVSRLEVLVSLVKGLNLPLPAKPETLLQVYQDRQKIPAWARAQLAAATQANLVLNYPNLAILNPNAPASRADVAAMVYQALTLSKQVEPIPSKYLVSVPR